MIKQRYIFILCLSIFAAHAETDTYTTILNSVQPAVTIPNIIDTTTYHDLNIADLTKKIDRTITGFGPWGMQQLLQPVADKDEIVRRQQALIFLLEHPTVHDECIQLLRTLKDTQASFAAYWDEHNEDHRAAQSLYFGSFLNRLNNNMLALDAAQLFDLGKSGYKLLSNFFYAGAFVAAMGQYQGCMPFKVLHAIKDGLLAPFRNHSPALRVHKDGYQSDITPFSHGTMLSLGDNKEFFQHFMNNPSLVAWTSAIVLTLAYDITWAKTAYTQASYLKKLRSTATTLQHTLVDCASFLRTALILVEQAQHSNLMSNEAYTIIESYNKSEQSPPIIQLLELFKTSTFTEKSSIYSHGHVLMAHRLLEQNKQEFVPLLHVIAQLDALIATATLIKEHQTSPTPFCFPVVEPMPIIQLNKFWLPIIDAKNVTTNSISLGIDGNHRNALITGPHFGGKSTALKAIATSSVLFQSLGIAPAEYARMPIFEQIISYVDPLQSIEKKLSGFTAQKRRIEETLATIMHYRDKTTLLVIDDPFQGTYEEQARTLLTHYAQSLITAPHCMTLMTIRFAQPFELEQFSDFHPEINELLLGAFEHTYKLLPGPATWWFADAEKRQRYFETL